MQIAEKQRTSLINDKQHRKSQTVTHFSNEYVILKYIQFFSQNQSKQLSRQ